MINHLIFFNLSVWFVLLLKFFNPSALSSHNVLWISACDFECNSVGLTIVITSIDGGNNIWRCRLVSRGVCRVLREGRVPSYDFQPPCYIWCGEVETGHWCMKFLLVYKSNCFPVNEMIILLFTKKKRW